LNTLAAVGGLPHRAWLYDEVAANKEEKYDVNFPRFSSNFLDNNSHKVSHENAMSYYFCKRCLWCCVG